MQHTSASITKVCNTLLQAAQNIETLHYKGHTIRRNTLLQVAQKSQHTSASNAGTHYCREYTSTSNTLQQSEQNCETHF